VSPAKTAEPIEMPYGLWAQVGSRNHILDGGPVELEFMGKKVATVSPATELIEMPFWMLSGVDSRLRCRWRCPTGRGTFRGVSGSLKSRVV